MTDTVEIDRLHKRYGSRIALHELALHVRPGTVFGLIGPNGAGKTTTLRTLVDVIRPSSGTVRVLGEDPRHGGAALRRRIGYVPGELHLDGRSSGHRMLSFYAQVSGTRDAATTLRTGRDLADRLGVDLSRPVRTLSKGNKQKIGLIQAFMHRPELLILDEPTSGLDPLVQREFLQMVREAKDAGQTVLLSSHVLSEIQQTADEVAVLANGRVVADGDVASLRLGSIRRVRVEISTTDAAAARAGFDRVPGLSGIDARDVDGILQLSGTIDGAIDPFIKALAPFEVRDLTVEEPDLEESVLRLYGDSASHSAPGATSSMLRAPVDADATSTSTRRSRRAEHERRDSSARSDGHARSEGSARSNGSARSDGRARPESSARSDGRARSEGSARSDGHEGEVQR